MQAYALSHIMYIAAYINCSKSESNKLDTIILGAYKTALCTPHYKTNCRLFEMDVHNTLAEIVEAQRIAQLERLSGTKVGRPILDCLKIRYRGMPRLKDALLRAVKNAILTESMPSNIHPMHDAERRSFAELRRSSKSIAVERVSFLSTLLDTPGPTKDNSRTNESNDDANQHLPSLWWWSTQGNKLW